MWADSHSLLTAPPAHSAVGKAVSEGERNFEAIVVCASGAPAPCGACRQFLHEFGPELTVFLADSDEALVRRLELRELLPSAFDGSSFNGTA